MASVSEHETALDQHVVYFLRKHPEFHTQHQISRIQPGRYLLDGREIGVEWHYGENGEAGYLVAVDGPLRQPFDDYVQGTEANAQFDDQRLRRSNLQQIPKERQLSFGDMHNVVSRLEAMKIAKEQAAVREVAAEYAKDGQNVPQSALIERYKKNIDKKLGNRYRPKPTSEAAPTAAPPVAVTPPEPTPAAQGQQQGNHPTPVFCSKHNATEKRKKTESRKVACPRCNEGIHTNYAEFSVCHACSRRENRCLCCGECVGGEQQKSQGQCPPNFCSNHNQSEKRGKTQPRNVACASCKVTAQTNYVDFTLCAPCSQAEQRCVCCGGDTTVKSAPLFGVPNLGFPQMQGLQMFPGAQTPLPSQCALTPHAVAANNPLISFNHMAPSNPLMSMKVF